MRAIEQLEPFDAEKNLRVVVESPGGSAVKLKYDPATGCFEWHHALPIGLRYPFDWGFVPGTRGPDGDPIDAFIIAAVPTYPGVIVPCRVLGAIGLEQDGPRQTRVRNDHIVAIPARAPRAEGIRTCDHLPQRVRDELASFFLAAAEFEGKHLSVLGYLDSESVDQLLASNGKRVRRKRTVRRVA